MKTVLASMLLMLSSVASASAVHNDIRLAQEALDQGETELALAYAKKVEAWNKAADSDDKLPPKMAAQVRDIHIQSLWQLGQDHALLKLIETEGLAQSEQKRWWCRVLERRGHYTSASTCWIDLGEPEKAKSTLRAAVVAEEIGL